MSLKAIKELVQIARQSQAHEAADAAEAEIYEIEKAAKDVVAGDVVHRLTASDSGLELGLLLERIVKEAE